MSSLGDGKHGIAPTPTNGLVHSNERSKGRLTVRRAWAPHNGNNRSLCGPFRTVLNAGDVRARQNYKCGGPNQVKTGPSFVRRVGDGVKSNCDGTGVEAASCNPKYVYDSSDFIKFKKQSAKNKNYNDSTFGGSNNGSYVPLMHIRR
jgi:hypothetical protein